MKLIKIMPAALLLSLSLGVYAQEDDELVDGSEEDVEVFIPRNSTERPFFHRVQIGFMGTSAKYTNNSVNKSVTVPASEKYFLKGLTFGWMGDLKLTKNATPLYLELGGMFTYHTGCTDDIIVDQPAIVESVWSKTHYRIQAFSLTIPVSVNYQFRNAFGMEGITLAPFAGVYGRFNLVANRWETKTTEVYKKDANGNKVVTSSTFQRTNKSLMQDNLNGHDGWMEGRTHRGKLLQVGAQLGVNAYYKHYSFGITYMCDINPFAKHSSPLGLTTKTTAQGGNLPYSGTGCDMEISTRHNFSLTVGYIF